MSHCNGRDIAEHTGAEEAVGTEMSQAARNNGRFN